MIYRGQEQRTVDMLPGIRRQTIATGEKGVLVKFMLAAGAVIPPHQHLHEQMGYLLSGRLEFTVDDQVDVAVAGDSWTIPGGAMHSVIVLAEAELVEWFAPVREDYL